MDRRSFLTVSAAASAGVAIAGAGTALVRPSAVASLSAGSQKGGGRALVAEPVAARGLGGVLPFALARVGTDASMITALKRDPVTGTATLSPIRDVVFHGFAAGAGSLAPDEVQIVAVHVASDGVVMRHNLWSHAPKRMGGTSQSVLFTAHDDAFSGFEVTHIPAAGARTSAFFNFMASGQGPQLKPGVYVLGGPRAATGAAPDLGRYAYSGDTRAPLRASTLLGLDFPYLSFAVHGEWI